MNPPVASSGLDAYLHAFRRHWLVTILVGLLCAAIAAPAVWFGYKPQFSAVSSLHIASNQQAILFTSPDHTATVFEIYKSTQQQYLKSRFVLTAALRNKPEFASFSVFRGEPDEVDWLGRNLSVEYPGNSEIMNVSLRGANAEEVSALVNAVVEAYMTEVVSKEQGQRAERLSQLDRLYADTENDWRSKRSQMRTLAERLGTGERETLTLQQQIALQQSSACRTELTAIHLKCMRSKAELQALKNGRQAPGQAKLTDAQLDALLLIAFGIEPPDKSEMTQADLVSMGGLSDVLLPLALGTGEVEVTEAELDASIRSDPTTAGLWHNVAARRARISQIRATLTPAAAAGQSRRNEAEIAAAEKQLVELRPKLLEELKGRKLATVQANIEQLQSEVGFLETEEKQLQKEVDDAEKLAKSVGGSSIELEMMRTEISRLEGLLKTVGDEKEKLGVEVRSRPRIEVFQKAEPSAVVSENKKLQLTVFAGLAGFFLPLTAIVWWDVRSRRVNSSGEVSLAGLKVIGSVPLIPSLALGNAPAASDRNRRWRGRMNESVDAISAQLLYSAERDETRVVLVSSAIAGEGKTTVATQLALSLARTGHRTIVVDFDLRRPSIDQVFGLPLEPGVAETIRKTVEYQDAIQDTEIDNLSVLTAGRTGRGTLKALANGAVKALFADLRSEFEFVVVDGSPILPVADMRFICQHVDAVVFAVLRDVSRVPNIVAACGVLAGFGSHPMGAVVTGSAGEAYYDGANAD
ncbi:MAG: polysaccharide biosynthesis tyrosine autokinase [Thermoguttaceae bacterium]